MSDGKSEVPTFWIIAGPNGSGKSTLYGSQRDAIYGNTIISDVRRPFWIINPDLLARRIMETETLSAYDANVQSVQRIEGWLDASVLAHQSVGVETVLSTEKYRRLVLAAKAKGYEFRLVYVVLRDPELNILRVKTRVKKGGHDVPVEKIRERWHRSLEQLPWFLKQADWALLFDNSKELRPIGKKSGATITLDPDAPSAIRDAVETTKNL